MPSKPNYKILPYRPPRGVSVVQQTLPVVRAHFGGLLSMFRRGRRYKNIRVKKR